MQDASPSLKSWLTAQLRVVKPGVDRRARITGRKIYILPTGYGVIFGFLLISLLIASINYANNPAFILTFLLTGVLIQAIFHTWRNLLGLEIRWAGAESVFAGETAFPEVRLFDSKRAHPAIQLAFDRQMAVITDCPADQPVTVKVPVPTHHRGYCRPGRLTVESRYPLGLLRAWCYLELPVEIVVWPRSVEQSLKNASPSNEGSDEGDLGVGADDFVGHRSYHPGDQPSHIHWKALAAEKGLLVKQFGGDRVNRLWLDFEAIAAPNTELRLSILAAAVQSLTEEPLHYGLRLPDGEIPPGHGEVHRQRCLRALALYGMER